MVYNDVAKLKGRLMTSWGTTLLDFEKRVNKIE